MERLKIPGLCIAAGFLLLLAVYAMPVVKFMEHDISVWDITGIWDDMSELAELSGDYGEFIRKETAPYRAMCLALVILPLCETAAVLIVRGRKVFAVTGAALLINAVTGSIFADKLNGFLEYINESAIALFLGETLHMEGLPIILWCVIHGCILAAVIWAALSTAWQKRGEEEKFHMEDTIFDEVRTDEGSAAGADEPKEAVISEQDAAGKGFYGTIICEKGKYAGRAFVMEKGEKITLGSEDEDDIFIIGSVEKRSQCQISYDEDMGEYIVEPLYERTVFMESGQPLGKERRYCIPRGMAVAVDSGKNRFRLG